MEILQTAKRQVVLERIKEGETISVSLVSQVIAEMGSKGSQTGRKWWLQTMTAKQSGLGYLDHEPLEHALGSGSP